MKGGPFLTITIVFSYSVFILLALVSTLARFSASYFRLADTILAPYGYDLLNRMSSVGALVFLILIAWGGVEYKRFCLDKIRSRDAKSKIVAGVIGIALVMFVAVYIGILFTPLIPPP